MRKPAINRPDRETMVRLLAEHQMNPAGSVLRLSWLAGLSREEIAGLTWGQVSFQDAQLDLPDPLDLPDRQGRREKPAQPEIRDRKGTLARPARRGRKASRAQPEIRGREARRGRPDRPEPTGTRP